MDQAEARRISRELVAAADDVYVTTIDADGFPQTRIMFNLHGHRFPALAKQLADATAAFEIMIATNTTSAKVDQLRANPAACLYFCQPEAFHSLMLAGRLEFIDDPSDKAALWQDGWEIFYPGGPADPDFTVLRLRPVKAKGWYKDDPFAFQPGGGV